MSGRAEALCDHACAWRTNVDSNDASYLGRLNCASGGDSLSTVC